MNSFITKLLIVIVGSFLFTGCLTVKKIEKNCDKFAQVCVTGTVTETVYRDTTIYLTDTVAVILPPDTITITDTITIKNGMAFLAWRHFEQGLIAMDIGVQYSRIHASAYLTDSTILLPTRDTVTLERVIKEASTTNTVTLPPEKYKTKFTKICMWWFFISVLAAALFVVSKVYTAKFNAVLGKLKI